jgi:hypothetical protein
VAGYVWEMGGCREMGGWLHYGNGRLSQVNEWLKRELAKFERWLDKKEDGRLC